jgi:hypothetical protein
MCTSPTDGAGIQRTVRRSRGPPTATPRTVASLAVRSRLLRSIREKQLHVIAGAVPSR